MTATPRYHDVRIEDRKIFYARNDRTVQHCVNGDTLRIAWDSEWEYMTDVVVNFINEADGVRKLMDATSGQCKIPWEVLQTTGYLHISVWGYIGTEKRIVTQKMERPFAVLASGDMYDSLIPEATEDVLQKILDGAHDVDTAIANANAIANEAQAIISAIHSEGFDNDTLWSALQTIAKRLTYDEGDIWLVGTCLYASYNVIRIDGDGDLYFVAAEIDGDGKLKLGVR